MENLSVEVLESELGAVEGKEGDCGCGGGSGPQAATSSSDLSVMNRELDAIELGGDAGGVDLEFAQAAGTASLEDELAFAEAVEGEVAGDLELSDLIGLARRYPGLKLTVGF